MPPSVRGKRARYRWPEHDAEALAKKLGFGSKRTMRVAQDLFIRRWGEMGQTWGINRTMGEFGFPRTHLRNRIDFPRH